MLKVSQLIKFISDLNPQNTPTRLCLFNFLKGFANPDADLKPEVLENFFNYALDFPHWQANKSQLGHEVKFLMENFNSFYQGGFDVSQLRFPQEMQIIEIEHLKDWMSTIHCYLGSLCGPDDKFRLINDQNKRLIAVVLRQDRSLEVRAFDKKFTLRGGILEPLRKDLVLHYTANLELSTQHVHHLEVAPYIVAQFTVMNEKASGTLLRGFVFQKLLEFKNENLKDQTRIFYPIKRLEQFFIDRNTDNNYQDLVSQLERTRSLVEQGDPAAYQWSARLMTQVETALEHIYSQDKFLHLLLRDLKFSCTQFQAREGALPCPNPNPNQLTSPEFDLIN